MAWDLNAKYVARADPMKGAWITKYSSAGGKLGIWYQWFEKES